MAFALFHGFSGGKHNLALENNAVKIGDARLGNEYHQGGRDKMAANVEDRAVIHGVFKDQESLIAMLKALKAEDLGLSVVVSGLFEHVRYFQSLPSSQAAAGDGRRQIEFKFWRRAGYE